MKALINILILFFALGAYPQEISLWEYQTISGNKSMTTKIPITGTFKDLNENISNCYAFVSMKKMKGYYFNIVFWSDPLKINPLIDEKLDD